METPQREGRERECRIVLDDLRDLMDIAIVPIGLWGGFFDRKFELGFTQELNYS
jgi:hypothetical protein